MLSRLICVICKFQWIDKDNVGDNDIDNVVDNVVDKLTDNFTNMVTEKVTDKVTDRVTDNQLKILQLTQENKYITTSNLANKIGISKRKVLKNTLKGISFALNFQSIFKYKQANRTQNSKS